MKRHHGFRTARLQPELDAVRVGERDELRFVGWRQRIQNAQHERVYRPTLPPGAASALTIEASNPTAATECGVSRSPTATSICGSRLRIDSDSISVRSFGSSAEIFGGST